jgi:uncharacterized membrane protein
MLLIGVDGGATEVKAHAVACDDRSPPATFHLRPEAAARRYAQVAAFAPAPAAEQMAQRDSGHIRIPDAEAAQGRAWVEAAAQTVIDVARQGGTRRVLVGIGMPGLKTADGRGICVINNGPRIPDYLDLLEARWTQAGFELAAPIAALGSDADYCGLGEEYAAEGLFRDVENSYYVGGGTGIADALKLRGRLVPFDAARSWMMKAWQMPSALGPTFEKLVSASALNRVYADLVAGPETSFPEVAAVSGDPLAKTWLDMAALVLTELIFERLWTVKNGRPPAPQRGEAYAKLNPEHEYRDVLLDRVVIGQRIGLIYAAAAYRAVFADKMDSSLATLIARSGDVEIAAACLRRTPDTATPASLRPGFVCASKLRAAPALGAAIAAVQALRA